MSAKEATIKERAVALVPLLPLERPTKRFASANVGTTPPRF